MNGERRTSILRIARAAFLFGAIIASIVTTAQGLNNLWMGGYGSNAGLPFGGSDLDFITGAADIYYVEREMDYGRTSANITDQSGNLLFTTNGYYIANGLGDTMAYGTGINPSFYTTQFPDGLHLSQSQLILPKPGSTDDYYLIHGTYDDPVVQCADYLYLTVVDMSQEGGLGAVVEKNTVLVQDQLNVGKITAVRHANGRDWWVVCHKINTSTFYVLLLTPKGFGEPTTQEIGIIRPVDIGQVCFSPDGDRFAYYWGEQDLDIFDFDRCTGLFSNPVHIDIDDYDQMGGVAFSPNSRYLYASSVLDVYQFDVQATNIESSMVHIAEWDSFYSPSPPFATVFDLAQLAPDGKIYISTGNGTDKLHVINAPDEPGLACDMQQHAITLPTYFANSLPNHPNYHLGPVDGSVCDSLGINAGVPERGPPLRVSAYPNPSSGSFNLSYAAQASMGHLEVRDLSGKLLITERIPQWSTVHKVALPAARAGMYQCTLTWPALKATTRIVIEP